MTPQTPPPVVSGAVEGGTGRVPPSPPRACTTVDLTGQRIESVVLDDTHRWLTTATVATEHATLHLPDPIGLWEALTDALREDEGEHLRQYVGGGEA